MSTTVKAADAAQFLSLVPSLLGFLPTRSVVLVPMSRSRSLGAMRLDLPPDDDPGLAEAVASVAIGMVCRLQAADGFAAVVYTDAAAHSGLPYPMLAATLARHADTCGLRLVDSLAVARDGWGSFLDPECPPTGRPLSELRLRDVPGAPAPRHDQSAGAMLPRISASRRREVSAALKSLRSSIDILSGVSRRGAALTVDPSALESACELDELPRLFERVVTVEPDEIAPSRMALLVWCLSRPSLRDIALVQWSGDVVRGEDAVEAQRRWEDGEEYPADLACVMWGEGPRPDPDRLVAALTLARYVASHAPKRDRPGPLSACAWLSWALGRSTHAERYAAMAHEIDPRHGMSDIVRSLVAAGHLPDWAFQPVPGPVAT